MQYVGYLNKRANTMLGIPVSGTLITQLREARELIVSPARKHIPVCFSCATSEWMFHDIKVGNLKVTAPNDTCVMCGTDVNI